MAPCCTLYSQVQLPSTPQCWKRLLLLAKWRVCPKVFSQINLRTMMRCARFVVLSVCKWFFFFLLRIWMMPLCFIPFWALKACACSCWHFCSFPPCFFSYFLFLHWTLRSQLSLEALPVSFLASFPLSHPPPSLGTAEIWSAASPRSDNWDFFIAAYYQHMLFKLNWLLYFIQNGFREILPYRKYKESTKTTLSVLLYMPWTGPVC